MRDATREDLQETKLSFVHRLDRYTNNVQLNFDAEYNLNYRFEIESCCNLTVSVSLCFDEIESCNLTGNPRDLHVTQAGGFGFLLDTRGRVRFLAFRDVEIAMHPGRIRLSINVASARGCEVLMIDWYKLRFRLAGNERSHIQHCEFACLPN